MNTDSLDTPDPDLGADRITISIRFYSSRDCGVRGWNLVLGKRLIQVKEFTRIQL